ncbi:Uncharacterised protein [Yersinia mollaretii]|nr:Uncharacterised protein [Yersinia mollaretii]
MGSIHLIAPCGDIQLIGPDPRIHFDGAGDQIRVILTAAVHSRALHNNFAPIHIVARQLAVIELRLTRRECGAIGVNKAAAITGNP